MQSFDNMQQALPQLTQQQIRAARLRQTAERFRDLSQTPIRSGVTRTQNGGLYETVGSYIPDYAGYARQAVGAFGGYMADRAGDKANEDYTNNRNSEILRTAEAIGQSRAQPGGQSSDAGPTEQALRAYLSVLGGPDIKDVLGKQAHVSGIKTDQDGNEYIVMSDGSSVSTGRKSNYNVELVKDPVTGEVTTVGKSGAGRGVASPVTFGQPAPASPVAAPNAGIPSVPGPQPVIDIDGIPKEVQDRIGAGVAFMGSVGMPEDQISAWVAQEVSKAKTAQSFARAGGGSPAAAPQVGAPAQGGAPLRIGGAGDVEAAKIAAQNAAAAQTAQAQGLITQEKDLASKRVELMQQLPKMKAQSEGMDRAITELENHPGLDSILQGSIMGALPNEGKAALVARGLQTFLDKDGADAMAAYDNVVGKVYQQAFETLRGGGQITEKETERTANAYARLQRAQSKAQFREALAELRAAIKAGYVRMEQVSQQMGSAPAAPAAPTAPPLPAGFKWEN